MKNTRPLLVGHLRSTSFPVKRKKSLSLENFQNTTLQNVLFVPQKNILWQGVRLMEINETDIFLSRFQIIPL